MHNLKALPALLAAGLLMAQAPPARAQQLSDFPTDAEYMHYGPNGPLGRNQPQPGAGLPPRFGSSGHAYFGEVVWAPPTPEIQAWAARAVVPGEGWSLVRSDARALVFTQPPSANDDYGKVTERFRVEYPAPLKQGRREFRSALAELTVDCATLALKGRVTAYEDQNLSGRTLSLSTESHGSNPFIVEAAPAMAVLAFTPASLARQQCAAGHGGVAAHYGPEWRALVANRNGVRLVSGDVDIELLGKLYLKFRIETRGGPQKDPAGEWRSATIDTVLDCHLMEAELFPIGYTAPNLQGERVLFPALRGSQLGDPDALKALGIALPSVEKTQVGGTLMNLLGGGGFIFDQCRDALARAEIAVATPGTDLRREAEAWVEKSLTLTGWSRPIWKPEQVLMVSDAVNKAPNGNRLVEVRSEYFRPMPADDGGTVGGRRFAIELDCAKRVFRAIAAWDYARPDQQKEVGYRKNLNAAWTAFAYDVRLSDHYAAACARD